MCDVEPVANLGTYVRVTRENLGYGLNEFARLTEVDRAALSRLETGDQQGLAAHNLAKVARGLGFDSAGELLSAARDADPGQLTPGPTFAELVAGRLELFTHERQVLIDMYDALIGAAGRTPPPRPTPRHPPPSPSGRDSR